MVGQRSQKPELSRRAALKGIGTTVGGLAVASHPLVGVAEAASASGEDQIVLRQGNRCIPVTPFSGEESARSFYDYRLPERFVSDTNGGSPSGDGPGYTSLGTEALQKDGHSLLFLYDGPNGRNLFVVHGSLEGGPSGGGSATMELSGLPQAGSWVVKDDYYEDPDTGEIAGSNYDNWRRSGETHTIDWTWSDDRTDGGVFQGLGDGFSVRIDPAFNEEAALYGEHYDGKVTSWELLVPQGGTIERYSLDMSAALTLEADRCGTETPTRTPSESPTRTPSETTAGSTPTSSPGSPSEAPTGPSVLSGFMHWLSNLIESILSS